MIEILWSILIINYIISFFVIIKLIKLTDETRKQLTKAGMSEISILIILNTSILFSFIPYFTILLILYKWIKK